jgi:hypothetical protein
LLGALLLFLGRGEPAPGRHDIGHDNPSVPAGDGGDRGGPVDPVPKQAIATPAAAEGDSAAAAKAVCLVVVKFPHGGPECRLGTAFGIGPRRLVTSGGVTVALQGHKAELHTLWARSAAAGKDFEIISMHPHPEYPRIAAQKHDALTEYNRVADEIDAAEADAKPGLTAEKLIPADLRAIEIDDRMMSFDVGVLEIAGDLPASLELADDARKLTPGTSLSLWGVPFDGKDFVIDLEQTVSPMQIAAKCITYRETQGDHSLSYLLVRLTTEVEGQNWLGSPVLNRTGRVVGVYSRATPPPFEAAYKPVPKSHTHDVVDIGKLQELAPQLINHK